MAGACPLRTMPYGGLPEVGGYEANTEYEIGARTIAESAHCILGSLGRSYRKIEDEWNPDAEWDHIREEMGIIKKALGEYARPVYLGRMNDPEERRRNEFIEESISDILTVSPGLLGRAEAMRSALKAQADVPAWAMEIGLHSYDVVTALARAMQASVAGWPGEIPQAMSAFRNPGLSTAVAGLGTAINKWEGVMSREVGKGAGVAGKAAMVRRELAGDPKDLSILNKIREDVANAAEAVSNMDTQGPPEKIRSQKDKAYKLLTNALNDLRDLAAR